LVFAPEAILPTFQSAELPIATPVPNGKNLDFTEEPELSGKPLQDEPANWLI